MWLNGFVATGDTIVNVLLNGGGSLTNSIVDVFVDTVKHHALQSATGRKFRMSN